MIASVKRPELIGLMLSNGQSSNEHRNYESYLEALQSDYALIFSMCLRPPCKYFCGVSISSAARTQISICSLKYEKET